MTIVCSGLFITRMEVLLVSVVIAHRCLVVRIVCITIPLLKFWCVMGLTTRVTPIFILVLWIVDGPRFHVSVSGAY